MTPASEPHPLRCETCRHHTENKYMDFCHGYPMSLDDPTEIMIHIAKYGCASHTSATAPAQERELPDCPYHTCVIHTGDKEETPKHYCKRIDAVIKELKKRSDKNSMKGGDPLNFNDGVSAGCNIAIALLQAGRK